MASGRKCTWTSASPGNPRERTYAGTSASVAGPGVVRGASEVVIVWQRRSGRSPSPGGRSRATHRQHGPDPRAVVEAVERGADAALLEGEVGVHDRHEPVELPHETSPARPRRLRCLRRLLGEDGHPGEDAGDEVMVLGELVEHRAEVGALGAERSEESVVLTGVMGLEGAAEAEAVTEDAHPGPQVVVHGAQLGSQGHRAVLVVMTWVAGAREHGPPSPSRAPADAERAAA